MLSQQEAAHSRRPAAARICYRAGFGCGRHRKNLRDAIFGTPVRRLLKFLHTMGAIGFMGSLASLLVLASLAPPPASLAGYALIRGAMAAITAWVVFPSLALTLIPGLLAIAATPAFHNAGWAWIKAATGVLIFAGRPALIAPIQDEARLSAEALAGRLDPATLAGVSAGEQATLWVLVVVATANVVLGIWRPRIIRSAGLRPRQREADPVPGTGS